ncbi:DICT sensory domain-containing protein [Sphaerothrix gracilis]|uniref:DICT sensory domain-containing protein n=1 Tax=Sphaerothrix gracilis TaxID=3151835 RepID=UPI0031FC8414
MLEGSILRQLFQSHQADAAEKSPLNFGVYYKNTLVALCHALEDCILAMGSQPLVIAAFQQGKWYLQEADRYGDIADRASQIAIMAGTDTGFHSHPTSQRENVALVDLDPDDPVSQEWHLIIFAPDYTAMVLCQELSDEDYGPQGRPDHDLERKFYGFWTFEPDLVRETVQLAIAHIGKYQPELQSQLQQHYQQIAHQVSEVSTADGLGSVVSRVVEYLQSSQASLFGTESFDFTEALSSNLVSNEVQAFLRMAQLADLADPKNPYAAAEVASLAEMVGQLIDLPAWQLQRLRLASLLHRIAPLPMDSTASDSTAAPSCPLVPGAQVLRKMPRLRAVAEIITHQTEWWDGSGPPAHLSGDRIPLESRILGLVAAFQERVANPADTHSADTEADVNERFSAALRTCQAEQGVRWDPKLTEILGLIVRGLQQGLSLPSIPTKITMGAGLLHPDTNPVSDLAQSTSS